MHEFRRRAGIAFVLFVLLAGCAPASLTPAAPAYWPTNGWRSTAPESQGMDSELLARMVEYIQQEKLALHGLLIIRNGYLVSELYVNPYSAEQPHWVASVTKSVVSTLVGIAIQKGFIKDVKQTLFSLLPSQSAANLDDQKKAITLEDLLTMTSGLDCHENPAPGETDFRSSQNWVQFILDLPMAAQPGTKFNYCTGAVELLSAILQKAAGMSTREFANQNLFAPLGIGPITEALWPSDPQGVTTGGYGLTLTPGEMAKLGFLFLNQGQWDGKTIVPGSWVTASTASHSNRGDKKEYGYLWWVDPRGKWYAALGLAGEHFFVYPTENLVVVFTSDLPLGNNQDLTPLRGLLDQYILPAVKSSQPLPANPNSQARLEAGIKALALPQQAVPQPLPAIAGQISGKTYTLGDNPFGWKTMAFTFQQGAKEAQIIIDGKNQLPVGLDNAYRVLPGGDKLFPEELRGQWNSQDTFAVDEIVLGQMAHGSHTIQFSGNSINITWTEKFSGSNFKIQGTINP